MHNSESIPGILAAYTEHADRAHMLRQCRSLRRKRDLLHAAVTDATVPPRTLLAVLLCLRDTLTEALFLQTIRAEPVACNAYRAHLRSEGDLKTLCLLCEALGDFRASLLHRMRLAFRVADPVPRLQALRALIAFIDLRSGSSGNSAMDPGGFLRTNIVRQSKLLEVQLRIDGAAEQKQQRKQLNFASLSRGIVVGVPVSNTLYHVLQQQKQQTQQQQLPPSAAPKALQKQFNVTATRMTWLAMQAALESRDWDRLKQLVPKAGLLFGKGIPSIGFDPFFEQFAARRAAASAAATTATGAAAAVPADVVRWFLGKVSSKPDTQLQMCMKHGLYERSLEILLKKRDVNGLRALLGTVQERLGGDSQRSRNLLAQIRNMLRQLTTHQ
jgi:hypothetical protein